MTSEPYSATAEFYDLLYVANGKDYAAEAADIRALVQARNPGATSLLDVACGTGLHLEHLRDDYEVAGIDLHPAMLDRARARLVGVALHQGDMRTFRLDATFDAISCLFSAIGHLASTDELQQAVATMARHLNPGGVLVVDGWIRPDAWHDPSLVHLIRAEADDRAVARITIGRRDGNRTALEMHHLVGTVDAVEYIVETHELTLFTDDEYQDAFRAADLEVEVVPSPMDGRDRYVGVVGTQTPWKP